MIAMPSSISRSLTTSGGQNAQHVVAGGQAQQPLGPQLRDEIAGGQRLLAADAEQETGAAQFGE